MESVEAEILRTLIHPDEPTASIYPSRARIDNRIMAADEYFCNDVYGSSLIPDEKAMRRGWTPLLNKVENKLRGSFWETPLLPMINFLKDNLNVNQSSVTRFEQEGKRFCVDLGADSEARMSQTVNGFLRAFHKEGDRHQFPFRVLAFGIEGCVNVDQNHHKCSWLPSKLHMGSSVGSYLEIMFPIEIGEHGAYLNPVPDYYDAMDDLFSWIEESALLLGFRIEHDIRVIEDTFHLMRGGDSFQFPRWIDLASVWTRFGGWTREEISARFLQRQISGGMVVRDTYVDPGDWDEPFYNFPVLLGKQRTLMSLYVSFYILNLPRIFSDSKVMETSIVHKKNFLTLSMALLDECFTYLRFMEADYITYEDKKYAARTGSVYSKIYLLLESLWPAAMPCFSREGFKSDDILTMNWLRFFDAIRDRYKEMWYGAPGADTPMFVPNFNPQENEPCELKEDKPESEVCEEVASQDSRIVEIDDSENSVLEVDDAEQSTAQDPGDDQDIVRLVSEAADVESLVRNLSPDRGRSWELIKEVLEVHPEIGLKWLRESKKNNPDGTIVFGRYRNYKRVTRLMMELTGRKIQMDRKKGKRSGIGCKDGKRFMKKAKLMKKQARKY